MTTERIALVEPLLLARIFVAKNRTETRANLSKALKALFANHLQDGDWDVVLDEGLTALQSDEAVKPVVLGKGATQRYQLCEAGLRQLQGFLGTKYFPARLNWSQMRDRYLVAKSLGIVIRSAGDYKKLTAGAISAQVLKQCLRLPLGDWPTLSQARDAACWAAIGVASDKKFTGKAAFPFLGARFDAVDQRLCGHINEAMMAAILVGARNNKAAELNIALINRLDMSAPTVATPIADEPAVELPSVDAKSVSLQNFADQVVRAASATDTGRFGKNKVFISHVWRKCAGYWPDSILDSDAFKRRLVEAHQQRLLELVREDLPFRRNRTDINESATPFLNTVFHYIRSEGAGL